MALAGLLATGAWVLTLWEKDPEKETVVPIREAPDVLLADQFAAEPARGGGEAGTAPAPMLKDGRELLTDGEIEWLGELFRETKDSAVRNRAFAWLLAGLTVENAETIRDQLWNLSPHAKEYRALYHAWGRIAGVEAVELAAGTSKHAGRAAIAGWASTDPEAARAFFNALELRSRRADGTIDHLTQDDLRLGFAHGLGEANPAAAAEFITTQFESKLIGHKEVGALIRGVTAHMAREQGLSIAGEWAVKVRDPLRPEAIAGVAREYARDDVRAALNWLESIQGSAFLGAAYYHTFDTWLQDDPTGARDYITGMPESRFRDEAISALVQRTIGEDSDLALGWAANIGEDSFRHRKFRDAFNTWAHLDAEAASEHLVGMASSPERDYAIQGFASGLVKNDPATAIAWADAIGDTRMRDSALTWVGIAYLENDPAAATKWLPDSGLPADTVARVLDPPPEDRHLWRFLTRQ